MSDFTIIVATFGADKWRHLAYDRALPSAEKQGCLVRFNHADSLMEARNGAAARCNTEWLVFLDGDDELAPGYIEAMDRAAGDLRAPVVSYVHKGVADEPVCFDDRTITHLNPCAIGTAVRGEMFLSVGGFKEWGYAEDWDLFWRCVNAGAEIEHVRDAVYLAHVNPGGRNSQPQAERRRIYNAIRAANL